MINVYFCSHIYDPTNKYDVLDAIDFKFDKEKARTRLDKVNITPLIC